MSNFSPTRVKELYVKLADNGFVWLTLYFLCSLALTLYNKAIMQFVGFTYPWMLTAIHTFCSAVGCWISVYALQMFQPAVLTAKENKIMLAFSVLYTVNIAVSNVSLNMVTVPFHQVVRATTPIFTILLNILVLHKSYSKMIYVSLVPVIMGVALATYGDYDFTAIGLVLTLLGTFLAALKTVVTNVVQVGSLKLHPMDLLLRMSPLAFIQCIVYAWMSGELREVSVYCSERMDMKAFVALAFNGAIAFFLNVVSFTANKKTSALTMTVAANVKQVLTILLAIMIFNLLISALNALGIFLTLAGGAWYTHVEMGERTKNASSVLPTMIPVAVPLTEIEPKQQLQQQTKL